MNLRDLQYVIALAQHQNFTRAAEAAAVSQPALSNQIKKLEAELGVPIFLRERNGVRLTAFGQELIGKAQEIITLVENITDVAEKYKKPQNQPLRLGMTPTLAAYVSRYFREIFEHIASDHKVIIVEEYPVALAKMVEERTIEMAFIARKSFDLIVRDADRQLEFKSLWFEALYLGVRKDHPLAERKGIWAHQVPSDQLIRFGVSFGYDLEQDLPTPDESEIAATGIDVKTARFETVCRYVAQSDACTLVNAVAAEQFRRDGFGLAFIPFHDEGNMRELGVVTRSHYARADLVAALHARICDDPPDGTAASRVADLVGLSGSITP